MERPGRGLLGEPQSLHGAHRTQTRPVWDWNRMRVPERPPQTHHPWPFAAQKWPSHGVPTGVPKMGPRSFSEVQQGEGDSRMEYVSWTKNKTPPITGRSTGRICQGSSPSIRCGAECFFPFQQSHPSRSISCRESCFSLGSCPAV